MSDPSLDATHRNVPECGLDIENASELIAWLRAAGRIGAGEKPRVTVLAGGVSNRTVRVERPCGEAWVLKQALSALRVAVEWRCTPARVHREARGMQWLARFTPPGAIPSLLFEDTTHHVLAMSAVPEPHENWKSLLLRGVVQPAHVRSFGRMLGGIHRGARGKAPELAREFGDRSIFETLRLEPFYEYPASRVPAAEGFLRGLAAETRAIRETLVHGDYSPKNILVRGESRPAAPLVLLDHEVIHWGDPMFDVGFALAHLLSKAHHLAALRPVFRDAALEFWRAYRDGAEGPIAPEAEARAVRHTCACVLARAAGRSPVEYLTPAGRRRQVEVVTALLPELPATIPMAIERMIEQFDRN